MLLPKVDGQLQLQHFWRRSIFRWLLRLSALSAIFSYGILIVSSPRQLKKLLDSAFEFDDYYSSTDADHYLGFDVTPYHNHLRTKRHGTSTSSSSSDDLLHISFQLHDPKTFPLNTDLHHSKCPTGEVIAVIENGTGYPQGVNRTGELPPSLVRVDESPRFDNTSNISHVGRGSGRVLDFTTTISTNLKILFIGDSVMMQLAQSFDQMVMGGVSESGNSTRKFLWKHWRTMEDGLVAYMYVFDDALYVCYSNLYIL